VDYATNILGVANVTYYGHINPNITPENFPAIREGVKPVVMSVATLNWAYRITNAEILEEIDKAGYRPADAQELVHFVWKFRDAFVNDDYVRAPESPCVLPAGRGNEHILVAMGTIWVAGTLHYGLQVSTVCDTFQLQLAEATQARYSNQYLVVKK